MGGWLLFISVLWYEQIFYLINTRTLEGFPLFRIAFFVGLFSLVIYTIGYLTNYKVFVSISGSLFFLLSFYGFSQVSYNRQMHHNYNWSLLFSMFTRVQSYAGDFSRNLVWVDGLIFIPWIVFMVAMALFVSRHHQTKIKHIVILVSVFVLSLSVPLFDQSRRFYVPLHEYNYPSTQVALSELGSLQVALLSWMVNEDEVTVDYDISQEWPSIETLIEQVLSKERKIDNAYFMSQVQAETNEVMQEIDHYFLQRPLSEVNAMTGTLKDKNLVLVMVEAFDYMAIDAELTPTLHRMMSEGWHFDHHYVPQFSCATGESEWVALNSLIPSSNECTPNAYQDNLNPYNLFSLFKKEAYAVNSFHNFTDQFYDRTQIHGNLGSTFYNSEQLQIPLLKGWPSDLDLVNQAYPIMTEVQPFMGLIITSSTHFPYDIDSTLGNRYLTQIDAVHPEYPIEVKRYISKAMELDKAMASLIQQLEQDNILDDTLIVLFGDHFPFNMARTNILSYGDPYQLRSTGLNIFLGPLLMYGADIPAQTISTISSTYSILPTLANLFGLPYDPRLAIGQDLFDPNIEHYAFLESLSWVSSKGYYSRIQKRFYESEAVDETYVEAINQAIQLDQSFSLKILKQNYFASR